MPDRIEAKEYRTYKDKLLRRAQRSSTKPVNSDKAIGKARLSRRARVRKSTKAAD